LNRSGKLGSGEVDPDDGEAAIPVSGDLRFKSLSTGLYYTCGVTAGGKTYCWGEQHRIVL